MPQSFCISEEPLECEVVGEKVISVKMVVDEQETGGAEEAHCLEELTEEKVRVQ